MKVIGTGAPAFLTLRVDASEMPIMNAELQSLRATILDAITTAESAPASQSGRELIAQRRMELEEVSRLIGQLEVARGGETQTELQGPTSTLSHVIVGAAYRASEDLLDDLHRFPDLPADSVRAAAVSALACVETFLDFWMVDHPGPR
jgi:hypothetical protein